MSISRIRLVLPAASYQFDGGEQVAKHLHIVLTREYPDADVSVVFDGGRDVHSLLVWADDCKVKQPDVDNLRNTIVDTVTEYIVCDDR